MFVDWHRTATARQKYDLVFEWTESLIRSAEADVRAMFPNADEREVFLRAAARRLGWDTVKRVYGWQPSDPIPGGS